MNFSDSCGFDLVLGPPIPPKSGISGFFEAFGKEVRKDVFGIGK